ncbi:hypothetical protein CR513_28101, partial [Mucuna pruriens]
MLVHHESQSRGRCIRVLRVRFPRSKLPSLTYLTSPTATPGDLRRKKTNIYFRIKGKEREQRGDPRFRTRTLVPTVGRDKTSPNNHKRGEAAQYEPCRSPGIRRVPPTRGRRTCCGGYFEPDEQSRLSAEAEQRHAEAKGRHRQAEERHLDAMRAVERREEEFRQQIAALRAAKERDQEECEEDAAQPFWGQPFCKEIDETPIPPNFREVVVEPFDGS